MGAIKDFYRLIVETALEGIWLVDDEGRTTYANQRMADMLGYTVDELIARPFFDFTDNSARKEAKRLWRRRKAGVAEQHDFRFKRKDGSDLWTIVSTNPIFDEEGRFRGALAMVTDITDRKRTEQALMEERDRARKYLNIAGVIMVVIGADQHVKLINKKGREILGYPESEIIGKNWFDNFIPPRLREQVREVSDKLIAGHVEPVETFENPVLTRSGEERLISWHNAVLYDEFHRIYATLSSGEDITEKRRAEEREKEIEEHKREFYRRTILAATEGKLVITERSEICRIAGPSIASWEIETGGDLAGIRADIRRIAAQEGMEESRIYDFVLCVGELTTNAVKHAGGGEASIHRLPDGLFFVVSDRGPGIEALTLPEVALVKGYSTAGSLGMGYKAVISLADRVYLATGPGGTTAAAEMQLVPVTRTPAIASLPESWD